MLKLTQNDIISLVRSKIASCSEDELRAVFKLLGFQLKEFRKYGTAAESNEHCVFEVHHKLQYIIKVNTDTSSRIVTFSNDWIDFGADGVSMGLDHVGDLLLIMVNMWVPQMNIHYDGPEYNQDLDTEYESVNQVKSLLECLKMQLVLISAKDMPRKAAKKTAKKKITAKDVAMKLAKGNSKEK